MKTKAPTPQQWQLLLRLQRAGCPLDIAHLAPPEHPLRVTSLGSDLRTNVFHVEEGIGIAVCLRIVATAPITVAGYRLEADWLAAPLCWVQPCPLHRGKYCLATAAEGHTSFPQALNGRTLYAGRMKSGEFLQGFLVGTTASPLRSTGEDLPATLWIQDLVGTEYPYPLTLHSSPP